MEFFTVHDYLLLVFRRCGIFTDWLNASIIAQSTTQPGKMKLFTIHFSFFTYHLGGGSGRDLLATGVA